eukprot:5965875-Pyramimonas_sp.AAC.1
MRERRMRRNQEWQEKERQEEGNLQRTCQMGAAPLLRSVCDFPRCSFHPDSNLSCLLHILFLSTYLSCLLILHPPVSWPVVEIVAPR